MDRRISAQRTSDSDQTRFSVTDRRPHPRRAPSPSVIELSLSFDFEETHQSVVSGSLKRAEKLLSIRGYNRNNLISLIRLRVISCYRATGCRPRPLALVRDQRELRDAATVTCTPWPAD